MSRTAVECFLARLYTDEQALHRFLSNPTTAVTNAGLSESEARSLLAMDRGALELAAASFRAKRERANRGRRLGLLDGWLRRNWIALRRRW